MKILYDHQIFSLQRFGGISRYYVELIERVAQVAEVDFLPFLHMSGYDLRAAALHCRRYAGFRVPRPPKTGRFFLRCNDALLRWRAGQPDILHHTYFHLDFSKFRRRARHVVTVYDMTHERFPELFRRNDPTRRHKERAVRQADGVIAISAATARDLREIYNLDEARIRVIHLAAALPAAAVVGESEPYILYVGERNGYKNFAALCEVYAADAELRGRVRIVAFGGKPVTTEEHAVLRSLAIADRVEFLRGDDRLLAALYRGAVAFVYPSLYEGFGIPPLEAMLAGCPVLASDAGSIPEVVGDAALCFAAGDRHAFASGLRRIVTDDTLRSTLRERGFARARLFSWERCARETLAYYQELAGC